MSVNITKRNGDIVPLNPQEITDRIRDLIKKSGKTLAVDLNRITELTVQSIKADTRTCDIDEISANIAGAILGDIHPDYDLLGGIIYIGNLHKTTPAKFSDYIELTNNYHPVPRYMLTFIRRHAKALDAMIVDDRDFVFNYVSVKMMTESYLTKIELMRRDGSTVKIIQGRPQYMYMKVAIALFAPHSNGGLHDEKIDRAGLGQLPEGTSHDDALLMQIKKYYDLQSLHYYTHATPTLANPGKGMLSCFVLDMEDTAESIKKTEMDAAIISKHGGGLGISLQSLRPKGELIRSTGGGACGVMNVMQGRNINMTSFDQGGRRKGAETETLTEYHPDIIPFLESRGIHGDESAKNRNLFTALFVSNLFYERCKENKHITLFSENKAPGLSLVFDGMMVCTECGYCANPHYKFYTKAREYIDNVKRWKAGHNYLYSEYIRTGEVRIIGQTPPKKPKNQQYLGAARPKSAAQYNCQHLFKPKKVFTELYELYEQEGFGSGTYPARKLLDVISRELLTTGCPFIGLKDVHNACSNHQNFGTIKASNLCQEMSQANTIVNYVVCCLASINLHKFAEGSSWKNYNHQALFDTVCAVTYALNQVLDKNEYLIPETRSGAESVRAIGIGPQGLQNVFYKYKLPYLSDDAAALDVEIFETMYYAYLTASCELAKISGKTYKLYDQSPMAAGKLHIDLWSAAHGNALPPLSGRWDWNKIRRDIATYGMYNSLGIAPMPTVTTSRFLNNVESFEPITTNSYVQNTMFGKFTVVNRSLVAELNEMEPGLWDKYKASIASSDGSVQHLTDLPKEFREIYKTASELSQRALMKRAADRHWFVDQAQSLNIYWAKSNIDANTKMLMYAHELGLKTGNYYVRTSSATKSQNTLDKKIQIPPREVATVVPNDASGNVPNICEIGCESCSS